MSEPASLIRAARKPKGRTWYLVKRSSNIFGSNPQRPLERSNNH